MDIFGTADLYRRVARGTMTPEEAAWILDSRRARWETWKNGFTVGLLLGGLLTNLALWALGKLL